MNGYPNGFEFKMKPMVKIATFFNWATSISKKKKKKKKKSPHYEGSPFEINLVIVW